MGDLLLDHAGPQEERQLDQREATYRTKKGEKLEEKEFIASFQKKGELADERLVNKYCSRRQSDDGGDPDED